MKKSFSARFLKSCPMCGVTMLSRASQPDSERTDTFECMRCQLTIFAPPREQPATQN